VNSKRIARGASAALAGVVGVALLAHATAICAQPPAAMGAAPQEVYDNVAPHPAPEQPIPYSHKTHLALGLTCTTCHTQPEAGAQMGFPPTSTCMSCHNAVAADTPAIKQLAEFARSAQPIPWVRVYQVLPGVTWSHQPHLAAGVDCGACHGDVASLDAMAMTTSVVAMASCVGCHETRSANTVCYTCHAWPAPPEASTADRSAAR
jgi:Cytochrome c7 and related cytochrome c